MRGYRIQDARQAINMEGSTSQAIRPASIVPVHNGMYINQFALKNLKFKLQDINQSAYDTTNTDQFALRGYNIPAAYQTINIE